MIGSKVWLIAAVAVAGLASSAVNAQGDLKVGVIPKQAAAAIARLAHAEAIDVAKLKAETELVG